jgi:hypothetical protein
VRTSWEETGIEQKRTGTLLFIPERACALQQTRREAAMRNTNGPPLAATLLKNLENHGVNDNVLFGPAAAPGTSSA